MAPPTDAFFSALHRDHLKPLGFRKVRHTFSRKRAGYTERFQFQGSAWNDSTGPWHFYINVGVEFEDLPPRKPSRDFPGTHAWARIDRLVAHAPTEFDLPADRQDDYARLIAEYVRSAGEVLDSHIGGIRRAYDAQPSPLLTLP